MFIESEKVIFWGENKYFFGYSLNLQSNLDFENYDISFDI